MQFIFIHNLSLLLSLSLSLCLSLSLSLSWSLFISLSPVSLSFSSPLSISLSLSLSPSLFLSLSLSISFSCISLFLFTFVYLSLSSIPSFFELSISICIYMCLSLSFSNSLTHSPTLSLSSLIQSLYFSSLILYHKGENGEEPSGTNGVPSTVDEDRRHLVEASVVRVMKARKRLSHNDLVAEISRQLSYRFIPNPQVRSHLVTFIFVVRLLFASYLSLSACLPSFLPSPLTF